jgi:hypothetical protein
LASSYLVAAYLAFPTGSNSTFIDMLSNWTIDLPSSSSANTRHRSSRSYFPYRQQHQHRADWRYRPKVTEAAHHRISYPNYFHGVAAGQHHRHPQSHHYSYWEPPGRSFNHEMWEQPSRLVAHYGICWDLNTHLATRILTLYKTFNSYSLRNMSVK